MTVPALSDLLAWRPSERERVLLHVLVFLAAGTFSLTSLDAAQSAEAALTAAQADNISVKARYDGFSRNDLQAMLAAQSLQLTALRMSDQTPQIGLLRMREELEELGTRAGLGAIRITQDPAGLTQADIGQTSPIEKNAGEHPFTIIEASLEADFSPSTLIATLREMENFHRAFLVESLAIKTSQTPPRMTFRLRILHQPAGPAS